MTDLFGVTLPEMIRELERETDENRMLSDHWWTSPRPDSDPALVRIVVRRLEILTAIIARLKRGAAEAA